MRPKAWVGIGAAVAAGLIAYVVISVASPSSTVPSLAIGLSTHHSVVNGVTIKGRLPSLPSRAMAYRLPAQPAMRVVNALADAFAVHSAPIRNGNAIIVQNGRRQLSVTPTGWKFFVMPSPSSTGSPPTPAVDAPPVVPRAVAEGAARHLLAVTQAPRQVVLQLTARYGEWQVEGSLAVDGIPVESYLFDLRVGAGGTVEYGMGMLGQLHRLASYRLIGVGEALTRLSQGDDGFAHDYPLKQGFHSVTVTNADLRYSFAGDGTWLVPTYQFSTDGYYGRQFALAVQRRYVTSEKASP